MKLKHKILKAVDLSGFTFLDPIIRLCYGEEPDEQARRIAKFIVVPILAFVAFIVAWSYLAPRHTTKSGEVPTPSVVKEAAQDIWTFHKWEKEKSAAYEMSLENTEQAKSDVSDRIQVLETMLIPETQARVSAIQQEENAWRSRMTDPLKTAFQELKGEHKAAKRDRQARIKELAASAETSAQREALKQALRNDKTRGEEESLARSALEDELKTLQALSYPKSRDASRELGALQEERQYLLKLRDIITNSRANKAEDMRAQLAELDGQEVVAGQAFRQARNILRLEDRINRLETSTFSAAKTFPYQIQRSLLCVFTGFLLASIIAIPLGILCGLSRIFMAAMTPFIAIFKPVSPIVWLPIALIVIGGFVSDPDAFQQAMNQLPLIGGFEINPAFLASAITVALCSLWPTLVNTALGVASIDKDHINVARVLKLGFWNRLTKIVIPSALPLIFAGLRISLGVGWMVLIAAELLSSSEGIGKFVWDMFSNGSSDSFAQMFVVVFVVGLIGFFLDRIMIVLQRFVSFDGAPTAL